MKPVQEGKLLELLRQFDDKGERLPSMWYVDHEGIPLWAQEPSGFCLIAGIMTIQPRMDGPEYRIADFEDYPGREITIVRVIQVGTDEERQFLEKQLPSKPEPNASLGSFSNGENTGISHAHDPHDWPSHVKPKPFLRKLAERLRGWILGSYFD